MWSNTKSVLNYYAILLLINFGKEITKDSIIHIWTLKKIPETSYTVISIVGIGHGKWQSSYRKQAAVTTESINEAQKLKITFFKKVQQ